jgi:hypothetical protein
MHINTEHAVGMGITTGLIFVTGVAYGAEVFSPADALFAGLVSVLLGFMPVATLFRDRINRDI